MLSSYSSILSSEPSSIPSSKRLSTMRTPLLGSLQPSSTSFIYFLIAIVVFSFSLVPAVASPQRYANEDFGYFYNNNFNQDGFGMGEYLSDRNHKEWAEMSGRIHAPKCVKIPSNMSLCYGIGYENMMLPNLLDHDSLTEATQQSGSWVPLVRINCHPDTQVFLCSLFSPVCLDRLIYPCRSMCNNVRVACSGRMKTYGFDWPEMLRCDKYPEDNDMCIKPIFEAEPNDNNCSACKHPLTHEALIDHFCRSDIAMRVNIKDFKEKDGHTELNMRKKRKLFKSKNTSKREARTLTAIIKGKADCQCDTINVTQERYLIMGNKEGDRLVVNFAMVWDRKDKEFKKGLRAIRKGNTCEGIIRELSAVEDKKNGSSKNGEKGKKNRRKNKKGRKGRKGKKGKKGKKGRKGRKGKKNRDKKKDKGEDNSDTDAGRYAVSKAELEEQALRNFKKASK